MDIKKNLMNNVKPFNKAGLRELTLSQIEIVSGGKDQQSVDTKVECNSGRGCSGWVVYERKWK